MLGGAEKLHFCKVPWYHLRGVKGRDNLTRVLWRSERHTQEALSCVMQIWIDDVLAKEKEVAGIKDVPKEEGAESSGSNPAADQKPEEKSSIVPAEPGEKPEARSSTRYLQDIALVI